MQNSPASSQDTGPTTEDTFEDVLRILKEARHHLRETIGFCSAETSSLVLKTAQNLIDQSDLSSDDRQRLVRQLEQFI